MSTYTVFFETVATTSVEVEASNELEAEGLAFDKLPGTLCAACAGVGDPYNAGVDIGDWEVAEVESYDDEYEDDE